MADRRCFECGEPMEVGYLLDVTHGGRVATQWVQGAPETSVWTGVKIRGRENYEVATYRCGGCGALRSYATERTR